MKWLLMAVFGIVAFAIGIWAVCAFFFFLFGLIFRSR